jgi:hypothetical protein
MSNVIAVTFGLPLAKQIKAITGDSPIRHIRMVIVNGVNRGANTLAEPTRSVAP